MLYKVTIPSFYIEAPNSAIVEDFMTLEDISGLFLQTMRIEPIQGLPQGETVWEILGPGETVEEEGKDTL